MEAVATEVPTLRERALVASVTASAAYLEEQQRRAAEERTRIIVKLKERMADALDLAVEDAQIVGVGTSSAVASVDGVLIQWSADEHGYGRRGSLALLRTCDRCGRESVPLEFHDLASLGDRLIEPGPDRHVWDCVEREELEPMPRPELTTELRLLNAIRDYVREEIAGARDL